MRRCGLVLCVAVAALLAGCTSAVGGHAVTGPASGARTAPMSGRGTSRDFPSAATTPPPSTTRPSTAPPATAPPASASVSVSVSSSTSSQSSRTVGVTGTTTGTRYVAHVYASDTITDCATHAYGARMIAFLRAPRCRAAHRVLATVAAGGRTVVVSAITTSFAGTAADPYAGVSRFRALEQADGTGSIDDLLREGHRISGVASQIPSTEAFQVLGQDQGVSVWDAWWATGTTPDQAPQLMKLEQDLFLTPLQSA